MKEIPYTKHKATQTAFKKKNPVNVKVYQNTKIDTQIHITDKNRGRMKVPPWSGQRQMTLV